MKNLIKYFVLIIFSIANLSMTAQQILLDKPVRAGELILFPELRNESNYYYLPDKPRLAMHDETTPQFSFLRYVKNEKTAADANTAISESAIGGGIVHALVELKVTDEQIKEAQKSLRKIDGDGKIVGPVIFKSGTVSLISSFAKPGGDFTKQVVGLGNAPIMENQKSAVSVQLNKLGSKILWESFNTPTPDFTMHFEMEVAGYLSPKRVLIEANFDRIYEHKAFEAAIVTPVLAGEIKIAMDDLFDSGAIKLTQIGDDEELNKLKETAYKQLIDLIFNKVGGTGVPQLSKLMGGNKKSMLDRATTMLDKARKETREENRYIDKMQVEREKREAKRRDQAVARANSSRQRNNLPNRTPPTGNQVRQNASQNGNNTNNSAEENKANIPKKQSMPSLAVAVSYQMKTVKRKGVYKIDLNKYSETTRSMPFDYNLGNVQALCKDCFREINLDDDLMKQREINASLGGVISEDFKYINFVNVLLRKKHQDGSETVDEVKIDRSSFNATGNFYKMMYGWKGDSKREEWLNFDYKTMWSVFGDHKFESDWTPTNFGSISLEPPVVRKPIYIEVDEDFIMDEKIKAVEVKIFTNINDKEEITSCNLKTMKGELSKTLEVILPREVEDYQFELTYFIKAKNPMKSSRQTSNYGRIDVDRLYK